MENIESHANKRITAVEYFSKVFSTYYGVPEVESLQPDELIFPPKWAKELKEIESMTKKDGKERLMSVTYDLSSRELKILHKKEWEGEKQIELLVIRDALFSRHFPEKVVGLGHTHPPIDKVGKKINTQYNNPKTNAFLSPVDMYRVITNKDSNMLFAIDAGHMMLAIRPYINGVNLDLNNFMFNDFYKSQRKNYEPVTLKAMDERGRLVEDLTNILKMMLSSIKPDFNIDNWNRETAGKYGLLLYYGDYTSVKRVDTGKK